MGNCLKRQQEENLTTSLINTACPVFFFGPSATWRAHNRYYAVVCNHARCFRSSSKGIGLCYLWHNLACERVNSPKRLTDRAQVPTKRKCTDAEAEDRCYTTPNHLAKRAHWFALTSALSLATLIHKAIRREDMTSRRSDTALYWSIYYTHLYAHMRTPLPPQLTLTQPITLQHFGRLLHDPRPRE